MLVPVAEESLGVSGYQAGLSFVFGDLFKIQFQDHEDNQSEFESEHRWRSDNRTADCRLGAA